MLDVTEGASGAYEVYEVTASGWPMEEGGRTRTRGRRRGREAEGEDERPKAKTRPKAERRPGRRRKGGTGVRVLDRAG